MKRIHGYNAKNTKRTYSFGLPESVLVGLVERVLTVVEARMREVHSVGSLIELSERAGMSTVECAWALGELIRCGLIQVDSWTPGLDLVIVSVDDNGFPVCA